MNFRLTAIALIVVAANLFQESTGTCEHTLAIIDQENQLQTETCEPLDSPPPRLWNCSSLQSALRTVARLHLADLPENSSNCVTITLPSGRHFITDTVHLGNIGLFLIGSEDENGPPAIHCNYTVEEVDEERRFDPDYVYVDYTLYLNRSDMFWMESVDMFNCPYPLRLDTIRSVHITNSTFRYFTEAVFDIFNSPNVSMTGSTFMDNSGTGISRFSFRGNTGAVAIGYNNIETDILQPRAVVSHCNFINNSATALASFRTTHSAFFNRVFTGRGGGLGIFINGNKLNITGIVSDCAFVNNYARNFGGALYMVIFGENTRHILLVDRNNFTSNRGDSGGGGILMTFSAEGSLSAPHANNITDCTFKNNSGETGGGVLFYSISEINIAKLERCYFASNHGTSSPDDFGSAVAAWLINNIVDRQLNPRSEIVDCVFEDNDGTNGIVSIGYSPFSFRGRNLFIENKDTSALRIIGAVVDFQDYMEFSDNDPDSGTALELVSFGQIRVHADLRMNFTSNIGRLGASISSRSQGSSSFTRLAFNPKCFVLYEESEIPPFDWDNVTITFHQNRAVLASALYASSLESCSWYSTRFPFFNISQIPEWPVWEFGNDNINSGYTDSRRVRYQVETFAKVIDSQTQKVTAWPGFYFNVSLTGWDEFRTPTSVNARFSFQVLKGNITVNLQPQVIAVNSGGLNSSLITEFPVKYSISSGVDSFTGGEVLGSINIDDLFDSNLVQEDNFTLHFSPCPGGYELTGSLECGCQMSLQILNCEDDQDSIIIQSGYWASASVSLLSPHSTVMNFYTCPPGYCRCVQNSSLGEENCVSVFINSDHDAQCHCDRQGTLCGECREGRGVSVLLNRCVTCSNVYGLLILVLIVVDVVVFIILTLIDKQVPASLYVFTFYIQIASYASLYFPETFEVVGRYFYYISSVLGFYFPYDFCLYRNMSPLISYFIRLFPFLMACLVIPTVISLRKIKWDRPLNYRGLCLIVLLVYSPTVHTAMSILHCPFIQDKNGTSALRWFVSGSVVCFSGGHLPLSLLAIAVLVLLVLLVPFTVVITLLGEMPQKFYWVEKIRTQLTHGYKDKYKWWFGVELSRRFISVLFIVVFPREQVAILLILCTVLTVYGYIQPYKDTITNILEITVELNFLLLLILVTSPILDEYHSLPPVQSSASETIACDERGTAVVTWILMPFLYFPLALWALVCVGYAILVIYRRYHAANYHDHQPFHRDQGSYYLKNAVYTTQVVELSNSQSSENFGHPFSKPELHSNNSLSEYLLLDSEV